MAGPSELLPPPPPASPVPRTIVHTKSPARRRRATARRRASVAAIAFLMRSPLVGGSRLASRSTAAKSAANSSSLIESRAQAGCDPSYSRGSTTITGHSQAPNRLRSEVLLRPDVRVSTRRAGGWDDRHGGGPAGIRRRLYHVLIDAWVEPGTITPSERFQLLAQRGIRGRGRWLVRRGRSRCFLLHLGRCRR